MAKHLPLIDYIMTTINEQLNPINAFFVTIIINYFAKVVNEGEDESKTGGGLNEIEGTMDVMGFDPSKKDIADLNKDIQDSIEKEDEEVKMHRISTFDDTKDSRSRSTLDPNDLDFCKLKK